MLHNFPEPEQKVNLIQFRIICIENTAKIHLLDKSNL